MKNCIILSNNEPLGENYYISLSSILNKHPINTILIKHPSNYELCDPTNRWNSPYTIDISQLINVISTLE